MAIQIKRVYGPIQESDGLRLLVDGLWPLGISKVNARLDGWVKELAPSPQLRTWFGHKEENFEEFARRYRAELEADAGAQAAARKIILQSKEGVVTLLFGAKDPERNNATVLKAYLESKDGGRG